jgi:sulfite reductase beta subunit-like hemoprotein
VCKAILEAFRDLGNRGNRQKTRMMWLIDELVSFTAASFVQTDMVELLAVRS